LLPQSNAHWFNNNAQCYQAFPTQSINNALPPRFSVTWNSLQPRNCPRRSRRLPQSTNATI
jgi:hypothetical protein